MKLEILTPDKKIFEGLVKYAFFPGSEGSFGVFDNHAPMISILKAGAVIITKENSSKQEFIIKGGVVEILKNKVIVLAE